MTTRFIAICEFKIVGRAATGGFLFVCLWGFRSRLNQCTVCVVTCRSCTRFNYFVTLWWKFTVVESCVTNRACVEAPTSICWGRKK